MTISISASVISPVVIPGKGGKPSSTMFGILDAQLPFRVAKDGEPFANGLVFGPVKVGLLLHQLDTDPEGLRTALRDYLTPLPVEAPAPAPAVQAPAPIVATLPPAPALTVQPPAPSVAMPPSTPKPVSVFEPGPSAPRPDPKPEEPVRTLTRRKLVYGLFPDGSTKVYQDAMTDVNGLFRKAHWKKAQITIDWTETPAPAPPAPTKPAPAPRIEAPAPAPTVKPPTPAPTAPTPAGKPILRELVDEASDTIVILYLDGTYKLVSMATV